MKRAYVLLGISFLFFFFGISYSGFPKNVEFQRDGINEPGEPYHLALADPEIYRVKIYKVFLVRDDGLEVTLWENENGRIFDLVSGNFEPVANVSIPPGHYSYIKLITSRTYGLKGYCYYCDNADVNPKGCGYWFTKNTTDHTNIGFDTEPPTDLEEYGMEIITENEPGNDTEIYGDDPGEKLYEGNTTFLEMSPIDLTVNYGSSPTIRVEFVADRYLELSDSTPDDGTDGGSPAQITFGAPDMTVSIR